MKQAVTREKITRHLLGRLPEEERSELTDKYFEDDDFFTEIMAVKDELLDEYRRGLLEPEGRAAFEDFLRKYPPAGHELALAKALDDYALEHENELGEQSSAQNLGREAPPGPLGVGTACHLHPCRRRGRFIHRRGVVGRQLPTHRGRTLARP